MSSLYICKKCEYTTHNYNDLKKHINIKKKCAKNTESINYSDDQLLILSLLPYIDNKHIINIDEVKHLHDSVLLNQNKKELFNILDNIDKNKLKKCTFCEKTFNKIIDLRKHVLLNCCYEEIKKKNNVDNTIQFESEKNILNSNNIYNNSLNTVNTINSNNINNNVNLVYFDIKTPVSFDENWDMSKIDKKSNITCSNVMYTRLLKELLENENNLNVVIDNENESGIVYKNNEDKYIQMKSNEIADTTMQKLKNCLNELNEYNKGDIMSEILTHSRRIIEKKHIDYMKDENTKSAVQKLICNIYQTKKKEALDILNNIQKNLKQTENNNIKKIIDNY